MIEAVKTSSCAKWYLAVAIALGCCLSDANAGTVLSNFGQSQGGGWLSRGNAFQSQGFNTGDNPEGYRLDGATIHISSVTSPVGPFFLELYDDGSSGPGSLLGSFTVPSNPTVGLNSFVFSDPNLVLSDNTRYYIVARSPASTSPGGYAWRWNSSNAADASSNLDWSYFIHYQSTNGGTSWLSPAGGALRMSLDVAAIAVPEPTTMMFSVVGFVACCIGSRQRK